MVHGFGAVALKQLFETARISHASKLGIKGETGMERADLAVQLIECILGMIEADQRSGRLERYLAAQFAADGASRAGNQHGSATQAGGLGGELDGPAAEQVLHADFGSGGSLMRIGRLGITRHDFARAGRGIGQRRRFAAGGADQQRLGVPVFQQAGDGVQGSAAGEEGERGKKNDVKIEPEAGVFEVSQRQAAFPRTDDLVVEQVGVGGATQDFGFVRKDDGRQIRDARADVEELALFQGIERGVRGSLRTRTHQTHIAGEDVPELRQLIQLEAAQHAAGAGDARVAGGGRVDAGF